jgi:hypothetical protein
MGIRMIRFLVISTLLGCVFCQADRVKAQPPGDIPESSFGDASAYYDAATGDIYLSLGENLIGLALHDGPFGFVNGIFDPTIVDGTSALGPPDTNSESEIGWVDVLDRLPVGIFNVGPLLPQNLTIPEFDTLYRDARVTFAQPATQSVSKRLDIIPVNFAIPEPSSILVLCCSATMIGLRRRRNHVRCQTLD